MYTKIYNIVFEKYVIDFNGQRIEFKLCSCEKKHFAGVYHDFQSVKVFNLIFVVGIFCDNELYYCYWNETDVLTWMIQIQWMTMLANKND